MEFQKYNVKEKKKKKVTKIIKNIQRETYKIDNKYQKAKIKNLKYSLEFQKYNVKEKKKKKNKTKQNTVKKL